MGGVIRYLQQPLGLEAWALHALDEKVGKAFNLYAEYIMRNAGLHELQAIIKMARRNINNLRYADDTTLMADREE